MLIIVDLVSCNPWVLELEDILAVQGFLEGDLTPALADHDSPGEALWINLA